MGVFFDYCTKCGKFFQNETDFNAHIMRHKNSKFNNKKDVDVQPKETEKEIPCASVEELEEMRLEKSKDLRIIKRVLKEKGIDCATMTKTEAQQAYNDLVKRGIIKE